MCARGSLSKDHVLITAAVFPILGPPIGGMVALVPSLIIAVSHWTVADLWAALTFLPLVIGFSWFLAGIPAAVTGVVWAVVVRRLARAGRPTLLTRVASGALIGGTVSAAFLLLERPDPWGFALCGAGAGAVLAACFPRRAWLNSSSTRPAPPPVPSTAR